MPREKTIDLRNEDCLSGLKKSSQTVRDSFSPILLITYLENPINPFRNGKLTVCDKGEWDSINDIDAFNLLWIEECARVLKDDGTLWISGTLIITRPLAVH